MKKTSALIQCLCVLILICAGVAKAADSAREKTKPCFQCNGSGETKCPEPSCRDGQADCPGPCLKLSKGAWIHVEVSGHPASDVWQKFTKPDGGWRAYNQKHAGHVIQLKNGDYVDTGACPICKGTTKVKCPVCKGSGEVTCPVCGGKKVVPASWTAFDNPKLKTRPTHFKLKDGRTLVGRKTMVVGSSVTIRTEKGSEEINAADIVSEDPPAKP